MGGSVGPKAGPTYLVVGDAAGTVNPFNGEGIDYAYETGRLAAEVLHEALSTGDGLACCSSTRSASRPSTACTSRWPGCSPRSSAGRP